MKPIHLLFLVLSAAFLGASISAAQTVTINLTAGTLYAQGSQPLADDSLIQLIASPTNALFGTPTATAFVSGDDVVLASFALNSATGGAPGAFSKTLEIDMSLFSGVNANDPIMLQWFTVPSDASVPGTAAFFGQFRTSDVLDGSDTGWLLPGMGAISLYFVTEGNGGSQLESTGVAATAVPEPATVALWAGILAFAAAAVRRFRPLT